MRLPVFMSLRGYQRGWLRGDAVAGLTVWAVLVPEALAYAAIAGVSPVAGLYTVTLALITGALALVAGLLRLGFVANFISEPVLKGFPSCSALPQPRPSWRGRLLMINRSPRRSDG